MKLLSFRYAPPPVYFMHIPKTGGSSLRQLFAAAYAPQTVGQVYRQGTYQYTAQDLPKFRCISSHWGPGLLPFLTQPGLACITLLRDPVEQFVSQLYFRQFKLKLRPHMFYPDYFEQMQPLLDADLRTLLETPITMIPDNPQTCCLGVIQDVRPYFKDGAFGSLGAALHERPFTSSADMPMSQIATQAHRQLETMAMVGLTEQFGEAAELLCDLLGIAPPTHQPTKNIGTQKSAVAVYGYHQTIAPDLLELIRAKTQVDQELYAHAGELFAAQLARKRAQPHRTISLAPRLCPMIQRAKAAKRKITKHLATGKPSNK